MVIGVPSGTMSQSCAMAALGNAMHPSVQSREIVGPVQRVGWQPAPALAPEQEELGLDAGAQMPAALGQMGNGALEHLARAGIEGLAVDEAVADDARHARHPGQGGGRAGVAARVVFGTRADARQAGTGDRRAGKTGAVGQQFVQVPQRQQLALGHAVDIGELRQQRMHAGGAQPLAQILHRRSPRGVSMPRMLRAQGTRQNDTTTEAPSTLLFLR